jgi:predicted nucleotidyltransferase
LVMIRLPQDFKEFLQLLNSKKIEYLVIGGYAVAFHGHPRATGDLDIWIATSRDNAHKTVEAIKEFGFNNPELKEEIFLKKNRNIRMGNEPLRIEILTSIDGVEFSECYSNKKLAAIDDIEVNFISLKDLKKNKIASGRLQDLADIENLE